MAVNSTGLEMAGPSVLSDRSVAEIIVIYSLTLAKQLVNSPYRWKYIFSFDFLFHRLLYVIRWKISKLEPLFHRRTSRQFSLI